MSMKKAIVVFLSILLVCLGALYEEVQAAAVWTQQSGIFTYYKVGPSGTPKYVISTDIESVPASYVKQNGTYIQCKSSGGLTRYWPLGFDCTGKQIIVPPPDPVATACSAQFVCHPEWGWIVDLSFLKAQGCEHVKITKDQALVYEGMRNTNGTPVCPTWPTP